jgi:hypothetical protein
MHALLAESETHVVVFFMCAEFLLFKNTNEALNSHAHSGNAWHRASCAKCRTHGAKLSAVPAHWDPEGPAQTKFPHVFRQSLLLPPKGRQPWGRKDVAVGPVLPLQPPHPPQKKAPGRFSLTLFGPSFWKAGELEKEGMGNGSTKGGGRNPAQCFV